MENIILRSYENVIQTIRQQHVLEIEFSGRGKKGQKEERKRGNPRTLPVPTFTSLLRPSDLYFPST